VLMMSFGWRGVIEAATDSQCEVEGICEDVEAVPKRPFRGRHLNVARAHGIHDRETGDMFLPSVHRNARVHTELHRLVPTEAGRRDLASTHRKRSLTIGWSFVVTHGSLKLIWRPRTARTLHDSDHDG
jgi:hypothetical protein